MNQGSLRVFAVGQDFGEPEDADDDGDEADAVQEPVHPEGEARGAGDGVDADHGDQQAQGPGDDGLDHGLSGQGNKQGYTDDHEREELGRPDEQANFTQGFGGGDQADGGDGSADEGSHGGQGQCRTGPAEFGHLVAVDGGDR